MSLTEPSNPQSSIVRVSKIHDSARKHVTGEALYGDDIPEPRGLLHVYARLADRAHARITRLDLDAVRSAPGVAAVISAADFGEGRNDIGPAGPGDLVFADGEVQFHGQPLFAVAAQSVDAARAAAKLAEIGYEDLPAILSIEDALAKKSEVAPPRQWQRGDPDAAIAAAPHQLSGRTHFGGQEHFYLEGQNAMAIPQEDGDMLIHSSTQQPAQVQRAVAKVLGVAEHAVTVENRRMGGGFGGKETQPAWFAAIAAMLARRSGRPVKYRLDRDDDIVITGKRQSSLLDYRVGFDDDGRILGMEQMQAADAGYSPDLSDAVSMRAMYHAENAYYCDNVRITSYKCRTNRVSNTAFRGFGGPQGVCGMEHIIDQIAHHLGKDPLDIRKLNFYGKDERNITPYGQVLEDNILPELVAELEIRSDYARRRAAVREFNARHEWLKKGISLTPIKFGISFTTKFHNQAGALVLVYRDGSVQLNHGGTEMGQGLHIKVAQVVADVFGIDLDRIRISATTTGKVPNASATSASTGTDLNAAAAHDAASQILDRLRPAVRTHYGLDANAPVDFRDNAVFAGARRLGSFAEIIDMAYFARVQLSAAGFYKTPKIDPDKNGCGHAFYYFAYGAAVSEVLVDTLTGEYRVSRIDILHDVGRSLNPAIDIGQIEGGFIQGVGWLTSEELWWDPQGHLRTHSPSTYKIPGCGDVPAEFRVELYEHGECHEDTIYRSKAVGEPPLMLAPSVLHAIRDAVAAVGNGRWAAPMHAPATPEAVLMAIETLRQRMREQGKSPAPAPSPAEAPEVTP